MSMPLTTYTRVRFARLGVDAADHADLLATMTELREIIGEPDLGGRGWMFRPVDSSERIRLVKAPEIGARWLVFSGDRAAARAFSAWLRHHLARLRTGRLLIDLPAAISSPGSVERIAAPPPLPVAPGAEPVRFRYAATRPSRLLRFATLAERDAFVERAEDTVELTGEQARTSVPRFNVEAPSWLPAVEAPATNTRVYYLPLTPAAIERIERSRPDVIIA